MKYIVVVKTQTLGAVIAGVIGVVSGVVVIWEFWYNVEDKIFPEQEYLELSVVLEQYDSLSDIISNPVKLEIQNEQDIEIIANSISEQIAGKLWPEYPPETMVKIEINGTKLSFFPPVLTLIYIYPDSDDSLRGLSGTTNLPPPLNPPFEAEYHENEFGSYTEIESLDLTTVFVDPFIDETTNCLNMAILPSSYWYYMFGHVKICQNDPSQFVIEGKTSIEKTFYTEDIKSIIIEPFIAEGTNHENVPVTLLQAKIKQNLQKFKFISIEEKTLEEIKKQREELLQTFDPSPMKTNFLESLGPNYILSGSVLVKKS